MATNLTWNDGTIGVLENAAPEGPGRRFTAWTPFPVLIGPSYGTLGAGRIIAWAHRRDYCVRFTMHSIPRTKHALVDRLIWHLITGGDVVVNTGDTASRVYTCHLRCTADGRPTEITYERVDEENIEYALTMELVNNAAAPMVVEY